MAKKKKLKRSLASLKGSASEKLDRYTSRTRAYAFNTYDQPPKTLTDGLRPLNRIGLNYPEEMQIDAAEQWAVAEERAVLISLRRGWRWRARRRCEPARSGKESR